MKICLGYLFKQKNINYKGKELEIFEFKDVVFGINFTNTNNNNCFNVLTGDYAGAHVGVLNKNNGVDYVVTIESYENAIRDNENRVNFTQIRENIISSAGKYYVRSGENDVERIIDQNLITFLEKEHEESKTISDLYSTIKKTIISQDEPIMQILTTLYKNQRILNSNLGSSISSKLKENFLICGACGTGKKEIIKLFSKLYNVPVVFENMSSILNGEVQMSDIVNNLFLITKQSKNLFLNGIIVIDGFEKLIESSNNYNNNCQDSLLKILEGLPFYINNDIYNLSKVTVVCLGNFSSIAKNQNLDIKFFEKNGVNRELIGCFSKIIYMNELTKEDFIKILINSDLSPLNTYKKLFETLEINFEYSNDFVEWLAEKAINLNIGANGLKIIFDECISDAMFRIFSGEYLGISMIKPLSEYDEPFILTQKQTEDDLNKSEKKSFFRKYRFINNYEK